jgi:hypothetical protein
LSGVIFLENRFPLFGSRPSRRALVLALGQDGNGFPAPIEQSQRRPRTGRCRLLDEIMNRRGNRNNEAP